MKSWQPEIPLRAEGMSTGVCWRSNCFFIWRACHIYEYTHESCTLYAVFSCHVLKKEKSLQRCLLHKVKLKEITRLENARGECTPKMLNTRWQNSYAILIFQPESFFHVTFTERSQTHSSYKSFRSVCCLAPQLCAQCKRKHELVFAVFIISLKWDARLGEVLNYGLEWIGHDPTSLKRLRLK